MMKVRKKYPETMEYVTGTEWDGKTGGIAKLKESELVFDTPEVYGGRGQGLCPYRLFLSGILGCLNNTLLDIKRRSTLDLHGFSLQAKLTVQFDGEGYSITKLHISGKLEVAESEFYLGKRCLELVKKYCPLTRSTKECIPIEYDIDIEETS